MNAATRMALMAAALGGAGVPDLDYGDPLGMRGRPYAGPPRCPRCRKHDTEPLNDGTGRYRCRRHADHNLFTPSL